MGTIDLSPMAVTVQAIGSLLLGLMLAQLGRIFHRPAALRWAVGWVFLSAGLCAVWLYVHTSYAAIWPVYLVCEWAWLLFVWAGCREVASGAATSLRYGVYALPLAIVVAVVMVRVSPTVNDLSVVQSAIVCAGVVASYRALSRVRVTHRSAGWRTMRGSLLVQSLLFALYVPVFVYHANFEKIGLLEYASIADLLVGVALGFGMILITAEETNRELSDALSRLDDARSLLEVKLHTDPLTEALSRHAFYSMQRGDEVATDGVLGGVVVMIDIDNLKQINDEIGHAAGDIVIRSTANAVRQLIRADDLLFRWGGDEFVVILPNSTMEVVAGRLAPLEAGIVAHVSAEHPELRFHVSWGAADFGAARSLDEAIRLADAAMYDTRRGGEP